MFDLSYSPLLLNIKTHSEKNPNKIALIEESRTVTYKELFFGIKNACAKLTLLGLKKGDCIILCASNKIDFIYIYFGAHLAGITNVIIDTATKKEQIRYIAQITKPKCILSYELEGFNCITIDSVLGDFDGQYLENIKSPKINAHDMADIMFTTGTTGNPKGVCLSHANIASSAIQINSFIKNNSSDVEALALPMSHSFALGRLRCTLLIGGTLVLLTNFANIKRFFYTIETYGVTGFAMTPANWSYIKRLSGTKIEKLAGSIRYIEIGSMPMSMENKIELLDIFKNTRICMYYGLTEASRSFFYELRQNKNHLDSIGRPVTNAVFAKIFSETGVEVFDGEEGEICIKGPHVMERYFKNDENENSFFGEYLRTGDLGYKKDGLYYLSGRKKEMINVGGNKVSPITIEEAILLCGVEDCACVAIPDPDGILGEVPKAFMVKGKNTLEISAIKGQLKNLLEPFQIPKEYEWVEKIPRTESGKIQRLVLRGK